MRGGIYPALRAGVAGGEVSSPQAKIDDADGPAYEPHIDGLLTFWDKLGLGGSVGYLGVTSGGQSGLTLGGELMYGITRRVIVRGLLGYVTGKVTYGLSGDQFDASAIRFGGGLFFIFTRTSNADIAVGLDVLRLAGSRQTIGSAAASTAAPQEGAYTSTGIFLDLAMSFYP